MDNLDVCECCTCGYIWLRGKDGSHSCSMQLGLTVHLLTKKIEKAKNCLVCCAIADPLEVCENTLAILDGE